MYDLSLKEAAAYVTHIDPAQVQALRAWADGKCLSASRPGIYRLQAGQTSKSGRKINRDPSVN